MATRVHDAKAWTEAILLPLAAAAANVFLEVLVPSIQSPLLAFLALGFVVLRHPDRIGWIGYAATLAASVATEFLPGLRRAPLPDFLVDLATLAIAGLVLIRVHAGLKHQEKAATAVQRGEADRFRRLLGASPDGIWRIDANNVTLEVNAPMAAMVGYRPEEMVGRPYVEFLRPESHGAAQNACDRARRGESTVFEVALTRRDGGETRCLCSTHPILDARGVYLEEIAILRDITERHRGEQARQQALSLLEATLESTADGLLVVDREGRINRFNQRLAALWRIPADILASGDDDRALAYVVSQVADPEAFLAKVRKLYATPEAESFDTIHFHDGRVFERYSMPQRLNGEVVGRVWSFRDVTDRERAFQEQRLANDREATIAGNLDAALFTTILDDSGNLVRYDYFSRGAERLYGVPIESLQRDPTFWITRVHSEDLVNVVRPAIARILLLQPTVIEFRYQSSRGIHRWHRSQLFPRREEDGRIHVDGIEVDVTERVKLEEQLRHAQKMEAIGQLAGGVAHDFNNILTAVIGYSDLLLARLSPNDPNRRAVEEIRKGGDRAAGLTRQLLTFGRRGSTQPRLVDPNAAVRELEPMLRRLVGEDVRFELALSPGIGTIRIDPTHFEQIVVNLAVNARDALPKGGVIRITTDSVDRSDLAAGSSDEAPDAAGVAATPGRVTRLRFSDDGVGMPPEVLDHIFEPFFTTKEAGRGTGLGLATVYGIVRQHHGSIHVTSRVGAGTTFEILLPQATGQDRIHAVPTGGATGGRERVLIVEDDAALLALTKEILTELGYDVTGAKNGAEALELLEQSGDRLDLLVTDVVMPQMGGRELADQALRRFPELRLLFVSGFSGDAPAPIDERTPEHSFLAKPYTPLSLARKVREVLDAASASRARRPVPR
jgi:PAS domain S-box-containing protein